MRRPVRVIDLGRTEYRAVLAAMRNFTQARDGETVDEIWLTEHKSVFTQGQAGKAEHVRSPGGIEIVQSDRGGQVTYHGPGQIVAYLLLDLRRLPLSVRGLVSGIEDAVVDVLDAYGVEGVTRADAPGVYVEGAKIASLGLRVRRGCSYHGLSLNVAMDLEPFSRINPCGLVGQQVTQLNDLVGPIALDEVKPRLIDALLAVYGLTAESRLGNPAPSAA